MTRIPARSCSLWAANSRSVENGTSTPASNGTYWNIAPHRGVQQLVADLNRLYRAEPALHQVDFDWRGFEWLDANDADSSVVSFIRRAGDPNDCVVVLANFTPVPRENYRIGVPHPGRYREILNTDSATYGGTNVGNLGAVDSERIPWLGREHSIKLRVPPLAVLILKPEK